MLYIYKNKEKLKIFKNLLLLIHFLYFIIELQEILI